MQAAKVQSSLRIRAVSPEPSLLAHTSSESRGTFRQKTRSLVFLNGWACAVKICHDWMLEDTNSLDGAHIQIMLYTNNDGMLLTFSSAGTYWCHLPLSCFAWLFFSVLYVIYSSSSVILKSHVHLVIPSSASTFMQCDQDLVSAKGIGCTN